MASNRNSPGMTGVSSLFLTISTSFSLASFAFTGRPVMHKVIIFSAFCCVLIFLQVWIFHQINRAEFAWVFAFHFLVYWQLVGWDWFQVYRTAEAILKRDVKRSTAGCRVVSWTISPLRSDRGAGWCESEKSSHVQMHHLACLWKKRCLQNFSWCPCGLVGARNVVPGVCFDDHILYLRGFHTAFTGEFFWFLQHIVAHKFCMCPFQQMFFFAGNVCLREWDLI